MTKKIDEIVKRLKSKYLAPDYLMQDSLIDFKGWHEPFKPEALKTVPNENGILFLAETIHQLHRLNYFSDDLDYIGAQALKNVMTVRNDFTRTTRRPFQTMENSHDNLIGTMIILQTNNWNEDASAMYYQLKKRMWNYSLADKWRIKTFLLPRDQAIFKLAAGKWCNPIQFFFLAISIWTKSKHKRMNRLRLESITMSYQKYKRIDARLLNWWYKKWWLRWGGIQKFADSIESYYIDPENPYRCLVRIEADLDKQSE